MAGNQDEDMYLFQGGLDQTPGAFAGQDFDNFLATSPANQNEDSLASGFLNPNDLTIKKENSHSPRFNAAFARSSTSSASSSSSSASPRYHNRNISAATTASPGTRRNGAWRSGINGLSMPANEQFYEDASMGGLDPDYEASNQEMASAFDFETAASTPSGYDGIPVNGVNGAAAQPFRHMANMANINPVKTASPRLPAGQTQFFFGSREASPLSAMLPSTQAPSPWTKHSPSSGLEETFNHMGMNGDSPGNATFTPNMNMNFATNPFNYDPDSSGTPSSFAKDISSPPSTIHSNDGGALLTVHPTSLKSRVETQIPIKLTLFPLPPGAKKLRLPTHTVSKPKFLAKPEVEKSPEVLELYTSLVCTSAMQDRARLERALARARGDDLSPYTRPSPTSSSGSTSSKDDEDKPLNGGEVKICSGCIQRERKRASRKKQKKPEEEEMFQKDEEKRVVVFNTNEIKDWVEVTKENQVSSDHAPTPPLGAMQVELPMRIACYCRHQNEKTGFQVIFTIKDYRDKVIAQAMSNSIMITDDHKTHNVPPPMTNSQMPPIPSAPHLPGAGVFATSGMEMPNGASSATKLFKQSFSTTDLHGLQHNFNPQYPMAPTSTPFAIPAAVSLNTSTTLTPRNLSRPASPSGPNGPTTKRRKQSGSGKLPSGLTMTRLDTAQVQPPGPVTMPNTAASSPYASNMPSFMNQTDRVFAVPPTRPQPFDTSPPTPNGNDGMFNTQINRTYSLENISRQGMMSAPSSRQPSRPGSPGSARNSFGQADSNFPQAVNNQLLGQPSRRPTPIIHKLVPAEGSISGGTEVTLLGNGFYQGLEVMFGDTEATTTTFWGEKCLNCIAPPAVQPGMVAVVFKHEHHLYSATQPQSHARPSVFTYVDDREIEMLRLALKTIGKQLGTDDVYTAAQHVLQQGQNQSQGGNYGGTTLYNMGGGHQRNLSAFGPHQADLYDMETSMLNMLQYAHQRTAHGPVRLDLSRPTGLTLLHLASSLGMMRFVVALLSSGADPNALDNNGHTPMHHAAMNGHEQIIHRLRLAGADHRVRSIRNFTPTDLATTLLAYQATIRPYQHYRSRSLGETPMQSHSRSTSSTSLRSFWENTSAYYDDSDSGGSDDEDLGTIAAPELLREIERRLPFAQPEPLRPSPSHAPSRRASKQYEMPRPDTLAHTSSQHSEQPDSPSAFIAAWRQLLNMTHVQQQQLAEQIQHFQENAQWAMPNLSNLPALPDYQAHPMVRRVSSLFPQRPMASREESTGSAQKEGWWEALKRSSSPTIAAPPAYDELYPGRSESQDDLEMKKTSAIQAAADAAADLHFETQDMTRFSRGSSQQNSMVAKHSEQTLDARSQIQRVSLMQDRKLFFFWIPLLAILLALMLKNSPIWDIVPAITDRINTGTHREIVEVV